MADDKFKRGLVIGRFQPFHLGHRDILNYALDRCDEIIICMGSAGIINRDNPFDLRTRELIIKGSMAEWGIDFDRVIISSAKDYPGENEKWFKEITAANMKFDAVFSGNGVVRRIFEERGIVVMSPPIPIEHISGTNIRELMRIGMPIDGMVADGTKDMICSYFVEKQKTLKGGRC